MKKTKMAHWGAGLLLGGMFLASSGAAQASIFSSSKKETPKTAQKATPKGPDLTFYGPGIESCAHWTEAKEDASKRVYTAYVLGELSGLENMCRLAKPGSFSFSCAGKKIQNAAGFALAVADNCTRNPKMPIAQMTLLVWEYIASHDLSKQTPAKKK